MDYHIPHGTTGSQTHPWHLGSRYKQIVKNRFCHNYAHFWKENPAFFVGIFFLLGIVSYANISYVWILLLLCTPFLLSIPMSRYHLHKVFMAVALAIASFFFHLNTMQHFSKLPEETIGKALFYPIEIKTKYSPFGSSTYCKGTCSFFEENSTRQGRMDCLDLESRTCKEIP